MMLAMTSTAFAQTTFDSVIDQIVDHNSALLAQQEILAAQNCDDSDANSISNPEVAFTRVWGKDGIGNKLQLDISQSFDWPGLYRARRRAAQQGQNVAVMELVNQQLELALSAKELLVELVYVRKQMELTQTLLDNIAQMSKSIASSLEQGQITVLDERKAAYEAFKYQNQAVALDARQKEIVAQLQGMTTVELNLSDVTQYPLEKIRTREEYLSQVSDDPLLQSQMMAATQEELNASTALQSRFPSFSLGYEHQAEMGDRFNGITASMTLPFFENRKARQAALLRRDAAQRESEQTASERKSEIAGRLAALDLWNGQMQQYRTVFGDNKYVGYLEKAYEAGELTVLDYIGELNYYQEQAFAYLETEYNYMQALSWLNRYELLK